MAKKPSLFSLGNLFEYLKKLIPLFVELIKLIRDLIDQLKSQVKDPNINDSPSEESNS